MGRVTVLVVAMGGVSIGSYGHALMSEGQVNFIFNVCYMLYLAIAIVTCRDGASSIATP